MHEIRSFWHEEVGAQAHKNSRIAVLIKLHNYNQEILWQCDRCLYLSQNELDPLPFNIVFEFSMAFCEKSVSEYGEGKEFYSNAAFTFLRYSSAYLWSYILYQQLTAKSFIGARKFLKAQD